MKRSADTSNRVLVNNSPAGEVDPTDNEWPVLTKKTIARTASVVKKILKNADDKKKKGKVLDPKDIGLNMSLLPIKCANDYDLPTHPQLNEESIYNDVCIEIYNIENKLDFNIDLDIAEGYTKNRHYFATTGTDEKERQLNK